jgi:hypothetical protein
MKHSTKKEKTKGRYGIAKKKKRRILKSKKKGPVMVSSEDELEMEPMFIGSINKLLGLDWINNRCFFSTLINDSKKLFI